MKHSCAWKEGKSKSFLFGLGVFLFLLVLSYGFPVTGDDWWFTTKKQDESLLEALKIGFLTSKNHYFTTNGRYLGNFLSGMMGCSSLLRELTRTAIIFSIFLLLVRLCRLQNNTVRLGGLALLIALPSTIYAQTYAWAAGFFNYVPPALFVLCYMLFGLPLIEQKTMKGKNVLHSLLLFVLGLLSQFFVENITIAVCLQAMTVWLYDLYRNRRFCLPLFAYLVGAVIGCVFMFLAPGYRNIGQENYREIASGFTGLLYTMLQNGRYIVSALTTDAPMVFVPLTLLTFVKLCAFTPEGGAKRFWCRTALVLITASPLALYILQNTFGELASDTPVSGLYMLLCLAYLLLGVLYFAAIFIAAAILPFRGSRALSVALCLMFAFSAAPLLVVSPVGPRCLYLSYILLLCLTLSFVQDLPKQGRKIRKNLRLPLLLGSALLLTAMLFIMLCNGYTEQLRIDHTAREMEQGATEITLPNYPFQAYVYGSDFPVIENYYYHTSPGDIHFEFVSFGEWNP